MLHLQKRSEVSKHFKMFSFILLGLPGRPTKCWYVDGMVTRAFLIQAPIRIQGAHRVFPWGACTNDVSTEGGGELANF